MAHVVKGTLLSVETEGYWNAKTPLRPLSMCRVYQNDLISVSGSGFCIIMCANASDNFRLPLYRTECFEVLHKSGFQKKRALRFPITVSSMRSGWFHILPLQQERSVRGPWWINETNCTKKNHFLQNNMKQIAALPKFRDVFHIMQKQPICLGRPLCAPTWLPSIQSTLRKTSELRTAPRIHQFFVNTHTHLQVNIQAQEKYTMRFFYLRKKCWYRWWSKSCTTLSTKLNFTNWGPIHVSMFNYGQMV